MDIVQLMSVGSFKFSINVPSAPGSHEMRQRQNIHGSAASLMFRTGALRY